MDPLEGECSDGHVVSGAFPAPLLIVGRCPVSPDSPSSASSSKADNPRPIVTAVAADDLDVLISALNHFWAFWLSVFV